MKEVHVKKTDLLAILRVNEKEHRAVFLEAVEGFRKKAIEVFEAALDDAKAGRRVRASISLQQPVDQTREYERAIRMLEMATEDEIPLTQQEFESYVMDRWPWKHQFLHANSLYSKTAADLTGTDEED